MQTQDIDVRTALRVISKNVPILECCPYHSQSFGLSLKHLKKMESWKRIERFVFDHLMPRARAGEIMIIVGLGQKYWQLPLKTKNVFVRRNARSIRFTSQMQKAMCKILSREATWAH